MQKIERLECLDSVSSEFAIRIDGGSNPKYFHVRFVGKSCSLLANPDTPMDYMVANEFICYGLANLVKGIYVPEYFVGSYEGNLYFFSRDIDPRPDTNHSIYYAWQGDYDSLDADEVFLANAFNIWVLNRDASEGRNLLIFDGRLYLMDFGNALLNIKKNEWRANFEQYTNIKTNNQAIFYHWIEFNLDKFKVAAGKIASIPDNEIDFVLKEAIRLKLVTEEEGNGAKDFLIDRKSKLLEVI